jgi:hypothetical protein
MCHETVKILVEPEKDWNDVDNGAAEWVHMVVVENHGRIEVEGSLDTAGL